MRPSRSAGSDSGADASGLGASLRPVFVRDAVLAEDDLGIDAGLVGGPEDLGHHSSRRLTCGGVAGDLRHHHHTRLGLAGAAPGHQDIVAGAAVERDDIGLPQPVAFEAADEVPRRRPVGTRGPRRGLPRKRVQLPAHQHEAAVLEEMAQGPFRARALDPGNPQEAQDFVGASGMGQPFPEPRE